MAAALASAKRWDSAGVVSRAQAALLVDSYDAARCARLAGELKRGGTWMVPTLTVLRSVSHLDDSALALDPRLKYIPSYMKNGWNPRNDFRFKMMTPADWAIRKRVYARQLEIARLLYEQGVKFLAGTDLANPFLYPGFSLHDELALLAASGLSPYETLRTATVEPARFLMAPEEFGMVAVGRRGDLVMVERNPLEDLSTLKRPIGVMARGRWFSAAELDAMTERVAAAAP